MPLNAAALLTTEAESARAGRSLAEGLCAALDGPPQALIVYATLLHDQPALLRGVAEVMGEVPLIGCSTQGVVVDGKVVESGYAAAAMALSAGSEAAPGALEVATATVHGIGEDSHARGGELARALIGEMDDHPDVIILLYDPVNPKRRPENRPDIGVDVPALLAGIAEHTSAPVIGAAAGAPWGPLIATFQYADDQVLEHSGVALGLRGDFDVLTARSGGAAPTGTAMTVTRAQGNRILELDHRPALQVWAELVASESAALDVDTGAAAWSLGLRSEMSDDGEWVVMAASAFDEDSGAIVLQASVPEGTTVMLHQRSTEIILGGVERMAARMTERLAGRQPLLVMGFECGARTTPFLGPVATQQEHTLLRDRVAPHSPWLGMMAWGEITPVGQGSSFCNYTYPVLTLAPRRPA